MLAVAIVALLTINSQSADAKIRMFSQVAAEEIVEEVDPCKAYQSNEGYAHCQRRQGNIKRMQAAKEKRISYRNKAKKRMKSKNARGSVRQTEENATVEISEKAGKAEEVIVEKTDKE